METLISSKSTGVFFFLGRPLSYKGYKLIDLESNNIFISQNVVFHE